MSLANKITWLRIVLCPAVYYAGIVRARFLFLGLFVFAGATDVLDGFVARRFNEYSAWGSMLDTIADVLFYPSALMLYFFYPTKMTANAVLLGVMIVAWLVGMGIARERKTIEKPHPWLSKLASLSIFCFVVVSLLDGFVQEFLYAVIVINIAGAVNKAVAAQGGRT